MGAAVRACRLLQRDNVAAALQQAFRARQERTQVQADAILREVVRIALEPDPNIGVLFDAKGNLRPMQTLTRAESSLIASVEVVKKNLAAGDGKTDVVHKLKVWDRRSSKVDMLIAAMKHLRLFDEPIDTSPPSPAFILDTHVSVH